MLNSKKGIWTGMIILLFALVLGACSQNETTPKSGSASGDKAEAANNTDFPKKTIEIIVPFAAGGSSDTVARTLAENVQKYLPNGQSVVVNNKPGGASVIGTTDVLNAKPDGYKLGYVSASAFTLLPHQGTASYEHDSFQQVIKITSNPYLLVVRADAPWNTFEEWVEFVKQNPNKFTYGTGAAGGNAQLSMEALNSAVGIQTKSVPFDGAAQQIPALLGGHTDGSVLQSDVIPYLESKELKVLLNLGTQKFKGIEDVPLAKEKGYDVEMNISYGMFAPKGLPQAELDILHEAFKKALEDPKTTDLFNDIGIVPTYASPEDYQKEITETSEKLKSILDEIDGQ